MTTSRWMSRSDSKASVSMVTLTEPSMAFSMGTKPRSTSPASTARQHVGDRRQGDHLAARPGRAACSSACSVKVPTGPRKPTRGAVSSPGAPDSSGDAADPVTTGQDSDVDEASLRELLDGVRSGAHQRPTTPWPSCAACRSPTSASPGSTTTGRCARAWPRPSTRRARPRAGAAPSWASCWPPAQSTVLVTRADDAQAAAALAANPGGARHGSTLVWRPAPERPEQVALVTAGTADLPVADECAAVLDGPRLPPAAHHRRRCGRPAPAARRAPTSWSSADAVVVVAGMEGALASVVGGLTARAGRRRADQRRLRRRPRGRHRAAGDAGLVRGGHHRRRHRQRVRRRVRGRPSAAVGGPVPCLIRPTPGRSPSPGSTASRASPATWRSARWSTPAPISTRCARCCERLPVGGLGARGRAGAARRHRRHQDPRARRADDASCARPRTSPAGRRGAPARPGAAPRAGHVRRAGRGRGPPAPPSARAGPLPRGRRHRRHHRRRRHLRRARGARRRRGRRQPGRQRHRHGARRPRPAARSRRRRSSSCCRARRPTSSTCRSS